MAFRLLPCCRTWQHVPTKRRFSQWPQNCVFIIGGVEINYQWKLMHQTWVDKSKHMFSHVNTHIHLNFVQISVFIPLYIVMDLIWFLSQVYSQLFLLSSLIQPLPHLAYNFTHHLRVCISHIYSLHKMVISPHQNFWIILATPTPVLFVKAGTVFA